MKCPSCKHVFHYRQAKTVEHNGEVLSLRELSTATNIPYSTLQNRYRRGDRGADLSRPIEEKYSYPRRHADEQVTK
jgi:transposase-like protein